MRIVLLPLGYLYAFINSIRRKSYKAGFFKSVSAKCPVISVGNLTMGGSGKTPFCIHLAKIIEEKGKIPAVILRGYKRKTKGPIIVDESHSPEDVGEEALIYKRNLKCQIVVAEKREEALKLLSPNIDAIILDDGFQHLQIHRDIDIVLVDANKPDDLLPFPFGKLREPISSVKSADLVAVTKGEREALPPKIEKHIGKIPIIFVDYNWKETFLPNGINIESLKNKRFLLLLGIGNPDFFIKTADTKGLKIVHKAIFPDHFFPSKRIIEKIVLDFKENNCDYILTSEKDFIKWKVFKEIEPLLVFPELVLNVKDDQKHLDNIVFQLSQK